MPLVLLGNLWGLWGSDVQHTAVNMTYNFLAPPNSWNSYGCYIVALDLTCSYCRRRSYLGPY
jgi:hypothetical protein